MKTWIRYALVGLFCLLVGFGFGRHVSPEKVVTVDRTEELNRLRSELAALKQENTSLKRHTRTVVKYSEKTGKPVERVTDTHVDKVTDTRTDVHASTDVHSAKIVEKKVETTNARPDWTISALIGVDSRTLAPVYGGHVQRRILGPVSVGGWVLGSPQSGVAGGLSLGITF